jgi:hypothetical protein
MPRQPRRKDALNATKPEGHADESDTTVMELARGVASEASEPHTEQPWSNGKFQRGTISAGISGNRMNPDGDGHRIVSMGIDATVRHPNPNLIGLKPGPQTDDLQVAHQKIVPDPSFYR